MAKWTPKPNLTPAELGWAAGVVDGEGCICIYGRPQRVTKKGVRALALVINVGNTDPRMPLRMQELFGGAYSRLAEKRVNRKPAFQWLLTGRPAGECIRLIYPYLVIKKEQAEIAMAYAQTISGKGPIADSVRQERAALQTRLRLVKHG